MPGGLADLQNADQQNADQLNADQGGNSTNGGTVTPPSPTFAGIYTPMLSCPESPLLLTPSDDSVSVQFVITADDENATPIDWNQSAYAVASITLYCCSVNTLQTLASAVWNHAVDLNTVSKTSTALKFLYAIVAADIAAMALYRYRVYAKVTLTNNEVRAFGGVQVEMNR